MWLSRWEFHRADLSLHPVQHLYLCIMWLEFSPSSFLVCSVWAKSTKIKMKAGPKITGRTLTHYWWTLLTHQSAVGQLDRLFSSEQHAVMFSSDQVLCKEAHSDGSLPTQYRWSFWVSTFRNHLGDISDHISPTVSTCLTWYITVVQCDSAQVGSDIQVVASSFPFSSKLTDTEGQDRLLLVCLLG